MLSQAFLAVETANTLIICHSDQVFLLLSDSQDQNSLAHWWHSFLGRGNECVTILFSYKNGQYNHFGRIPLHSLLVPQM